MKTLTKIQGLLIDLDGTLYVGDQLIPGSIEAIEKIKKAGLAIRFLTNTSTKSLESLHKKVVGMGLPIEKDEIISATQAAVLYLRKQNNPSCKFLLTEDPLTDFSQFDKKEKKPDYIVVGDMGKSWNWHMVNDAFKLIVGGARLLALHRGRYWQTEEELRVDLGAFVAGLEYASGTTAIVVGKPSKLFFQLGMESLGLKADQVAMVGDDIDSDIGGAQSLGITGVLVKTGKFRESTLARSEIKPDLIVDSFSQYCDQYVL